MQHEFGRWGELAVNQGGGEPVADDRTVPLGQSRTRVVLLGSGEGSHEVVLALQRLGAEVIAVGRPAGAGHRGADQSVVVDLADADELSATIGRLQPKVVVTAADVPGDALTAAAGTITLVPGERAARLIADAEGMRRLAADELGLPTAPFWFADSVDELRSVTEHAGFPMVVKPVAAPPGAGRSVLVRPADVEPAWQLAVAANGPAARQRVLAETVVEVDCQITLLTVGRDGPGGPVVDFCAPIGHRSIDGPDGRLEVESWQPQAMSGAALDAARSIAARVVRAMDGRGLFGVELAIRGDEVYFCGVTGWPYDVLGVTTRTQRLSGFDLQARAILALPLDTIMISPGAARLVYAGRRQAGGTRPDVAAVLADALTVPESDATVFDHPEGHPRRLGMVVATGPDVTVARDRARQVCAALGELWQPRDS